MKVYKLCSIITFGFISMLFSAVFFGSSSTSATSPYDNLIHVTTELKITSPDGTKTRNFAGTWASDIVANCSPDVGASLNSALTPGGSWMVARYNEGNDIRAYWRSDRSVNLGFDSTVSGGYGFYRPAQSGISIAFLSLNNDGSVSCGPGGGIANGSGTKDYMAMNPGYQFDFLLVNWPISYPSGYSGEIPPDTYAFFGDFLEYKIVDKLGTFTVKNVDKTRINKCELFIDDNPNVEPDDGEVNESQYTINDCSSTVTHQWSQYGTYYVRLELTVSASGAIRQYTETFKVDGSTYDGTFNEDGKKDNTALTYEDCTTYGADVIGGFGCVMRNFGKWLSNQFTTLFVPSANDFGNFYSDANDFLHQKLGLLLYPFDWFYTLFNSFAASTASCAGWNMSAVPSVQPNGTFFGTHVNLNPCSAQSSFPQIYNISVFFVRAMTVLAMVFAVYRKLLVTLGDHEKGEHGRGRALWG